MNAFFIAAAVFLLITIFVGLIRLVQGPTAVDRILTIQLFGSTGVAILLLLSAALEQPALQDIALVFALLAIMTTVGFVRQVAPRINKIKEQD